MVFDSLATLTAVLLMARDGGRAQLATTITRMDAGVEPPWMADICSCNICISYIRVGRFTACHCQLCPVHVPDSCKDDLT